MDLLVPLQFDAIASVPGILGTLILIAIVILVGRIVLRIAWKVVIVGTVLVAVLWLLGLLGPFQGMF